MRVKLLLLMKSLKIRDYTHERFQNSKPTEPVFSYGSFGHAHQRWCHHYHESFLKQKLSFLANNFTKPISIMRWVLTLLGFILD